MWLSATKEVPMKDYKPKVITVTNNIRATIYLDGDFNKPTRHRMVEEQIGCVLIFTKEEY